MLGLPQRPVRALAKCNAQQLVSSCRPLDRRCYNRSYFGPSSCVEQRMRTCHLVPVAILSGACGHMAIEPWNLLHMLPISIIQQMTGLGGSLCWLGLSAWKQFCVVAWVALGSSFLGDMVLMPQLHCSWQKSFSG